MDATSDTYLSIASPSEGLYKDKGSRFIAKAYPVETEQEVKDIVSSLKKEYHDARHHCYAFRLGVDGDVWRASDDGEPAGTAGRQILSQLESLSLSDVAVVVVRYFGGIKLGVPGLIKAYRSAAADALGNVEARQKIAGRWITLSFPCGSIPSVMKLIKDMNLPQRNQSFSEYCSMDVRVRKTLEKDFLERIGKLGNFIK